MLANLEVRARGASYPKIPKKIDGYMFSKLEINYIEQINYLKEQIRLKDELLSKSSLQEVITVEKANPELRSFQPVGKVSPGRNLAIMESIERENYWKAEIKRRESEANKENVIMGES